MAEGNGFNRARVHKINMEKYVTPVIQWKRPDHEAEIVRHVAAIHATLGQKRDGVGYSYNAFNDKLIERVRERLRNAGVTIFKFRDHRTNEFVVRAVRRRR